MKYLLTIIIGFTFMTYGVFTHNINPLSLDMDCYKKDSSSAVACNFEFTNNGPKDLNVLKRDTPLEGLLSPFIAVYSLETKQPLQYKGFLFHRIPPTKDEFVLLKAGKSISSTVDITKAFSFNNDGLYEIRYIKPLQFNDGPSSFQITIPSTVSVYVEDTHLLSQLTYMEESQLQAENEEVSEIVTVNQGCRIKFIGGTTTQRLNFQRGHNRMCSKLPGVARNLAYNNLYRTWFGTYSATRFSTVRNVLQTSANGLQNDLVTYNMNGPRCSPNTVAYTFKGARTVYACPYMHGIQKLCINSNNIPDTQEAILFHEWSHAYGYTSDHAYGVALDRHLAQNDPDKAVNNADNFERYYCPASFAC